MVFVCVCSVTSLTSRCLAARNLASVSSPHHYYHHYYHHHYHHYYYHGICVCLQRDVTDQQVSGSQESGPRVQSRSDGSRSADSMHMSDSRVQPYPDDARSPQPANPHLVDVIEPISPPGSQSATY